MPETVEEIWNLVSNKCYFWSNLNFDFQLTFNCYDLVLLGKCLGFAPRSESFAIEPSVQVCSIPSLSEFRFAEMSCFATPASASSIRTQIRCLAALVLNVPTDFLFRNFVSSKEKSSALCSQVARTIKQGFALRSSRLFIPQLLTKK